MQIKFFGSFFIMKIYITKMETKYKWFYFVQIENCFHEPFIDIYNSFIVLSTQPQQD